MVGDVQQLLAQACADLGSTMARSAQPGEVLQEIALHARRLLGVRDAGVLVGGEGPVVAGAVDDLVSTMSAVETTTGGPATDALAKRTVVRVHAVVDTAEAYPEWVREARAHDVAAWLAVPSRAGTLGAVLCAASSKPRRWHDEEVCALQVLADLAAGILAHASELGRVRRTAEQLQEALDHRLVIEQAKGILAGELGCTLDQAFAILRDRARRNSATVRSVAHAVVNLGLRPPPIPSEGRDREAGPSWSP